LENLLADPNRIAPVRNHPALPWREIGLFMVDIRWREGVSARVVEFTTPLYIGPARCAVWAEINLDASLWTIPALRMKASKEHRVPLSSGAMLVLALMRNPADLCSLTAIVMCP
jgi:integrase